MTEQDQNASRGGDTQYAEPLATARGKPADSYASTADALVARIVALIPAQPHILELDSPWALFKVPGFRCDDLQPSLAQAAWALAKAKALVRAEGRQP